MLSKLGEFLEELKKESLTPHSFSFTPVIFYDEDGNKYQAKYIDSEKGKQEVKIKIIRIK
jgi:hypothetical protein